MFALKKKYYLIIESIKDINLRNIKRYNKFIIIYRNQDTNDDINDLIKFRKECKLKLIEFYVANDVKLGTKLRSDGIYLSSYNKSFKVLNNKNFKFKIIGSAHNINEVYYKIKQGCGAIVLSKLFKVNYSKKSPYLDIVGFNVYTKKYHTKLVPLGGIKMNNLNKLKLVNCEAVAILS